MEICVLIKSIFKGFWGFGVGESLHVFWDQSHQRWSPDLVEYRLTLVGSEPFSKVPMI